MTSDDLSKSVVAAEGLGEKAKVRSLDRASLRSRRAKMLKERSRQSLAGSRSSSPSKPQDDDAQSMSDSSLKARIQSGILRSGTPSKSTQRKTRCEDQVSASSKNGKDVAEREYVPNTPEESVTPAAKNLVDDMDGESSEEESTPSSHITQRSRDAAAKLMLARVRARRNELVNEESPGTQTKLKAKSKPVMVDAPRKESCREELATLEVPTALKNTSKKEAAPTQKVPGDVLALSEVSTTHNPKSATRTPLKQLPLSVKRERAQREENRRSHQKSPSQTETRRNLDKRTARMRYSGIFRAEIEKHRKQQPSIQSGGCSSDTDLYQREQNGISVFVRKRPLFEYEEERNDYDVVDMAGPVDGDSNYDKVTIHNCMMHPDMRRMFVQQVSFPCSAAFDENCSNIDIFNKIARPLVKLAANGCVATILMYGQTGSGKTHTMTGIEEQSADSLFGELANAAVLGGSRTRNRSGDHPKVSVQFVELCGKNCKDLLGRGEEVKLAEEKDGTVRLVNATAAVAETSRDLTRLIAKGKSRRATEATDVNGVSSRSHAVCQIEVRFPNRRKRGLLTLIDCAGSERRHDSMYHSSKRQKESAEINASLWALKECIRARNNGEVVPYRSSLLTRILRESFERDGAKLSVIATVAPNASDTEHSSETLKTVSTIVGCENMILEGEKHEVSPQKKKKPDTLPPRAWDHSQLVAFLGRKRIDLKVPENIDGKMVMRMNVQQIRARLCRGNSDDKLPNIVFNALRKENDRVSSIQRKEQLDMKKQRKQEEWENTAVYR